MRSLKIIALGLLVGLFAWATPGSLSVTQAAKLHKSKLVVLVPGYVPKGFGVSGLELNSLEYRLFYRGPGKANFSVWGRSSGVCDGGPGQAHYAVKRGPFRGNVVEFNEDRGFYTGFMKLAPGGGELVPSFDVEGQNIRPQEAVRIVESLRRL